MIQKPKVSENLADRFRDVLSPRKPIELKTNLAVRPCNGCPGKIQIGEQMIVTQSPLGEQHFHQMCWKNEGHKK